MPREASTHLSRKGGMSNLNRVLKERSKQRNRKTEAQKDKKQKNKNKKFKKEFQDKKPHSGPGRTRLERAEGPTRDIMYLSVWGRYVPYTCAAGHWTGASHTWGRHSSTKLYVELRVFSVFILRQVSLHYQGWPYVTFLWPPEQLGLGACASKLSQFHTHMCFT